MPSYIFQENVSETWFFIWSPSDLLTVFTRSTPFWFCSHLLIQILHFKKHFICSILTNWLSGALQAAPTSADLPSSHHGTNGLTRVKDSSLRHFLVTNLAWKTWLSTVKNRKNSCKINIINNISLLFYTLQDLPTQWLDSPTSIINPENAPQACPWPIWWWHFLNSSFPHQSSTQKTPTALPMVNLMVALSQLKFSLLKLH